MNTEIGTLELLVLTHKENWRSRLPRGWSYTNRLFFHSKRDMFVFIDHVTSETGDVVGAVKTVQMKDSDSKLEVGPYQELLQKFGAEFCNV